MATEPANRCPWCLRAFIKTAALAVSAVGTAGGLRAAFTASDDHETPFYSGLRYVSAIALGLWTVGLFTAIIAPEFARLTYMGLREDGAGSGRPDGRPPGARAQGDAGDATQRQHQRASNTKLDILFNAAAAFRTAVAAAAHIDAVDVESNRLAQGVGEVDSLPGASDGPLDVGSRRQAFRPRVEPIGPLAAAAATFLAAVAASAESDAEEKKDVESGSGSRGPGGARGPRTIIRMLDSASSRTIEVNMDQDEGASADVRAMLEAGAGSGSADGSHDGPAPGLGQPARSGE
jgi:hypothetical protein